MLEYVIKIDIRNDLKILYLEICIFWGNFFKKFIEIIVYICIYVCYILKNSKVLCILICCNEMVIFLKIKWKNLMFFVCKVKLYYYKYNII